MKFYCTSILLEQYGNPRVSVELKCFCCNVVVMFCPCLHHLVTNSVLYLFVCPIPLVGNHLSDDDCVEGKRENYCSVLCCVRQLCTVVGAHI